MSEGRRAHLLPFSLDAAVDECVIARRDFYLGLWAGRALGLGGDALQLLSLIHI